MSINIINIIIIEIVLDSLTQQSFGVKCNDIHGVWEFLLGDSYINKLSYDKSICDKGTHAQYPDGISQASIGNLLKEIILFILAH